MSDIGHNNPPLDPKETIQNNINRKKPILDRDPQYFEGIPIPSWIELSLIDVCNRTCSFCPKSDENVAPDTYQKMTMKLIDKLIYDLKKINFEGAFCLCGYGEPMLHKNYIDISNKLGELGGVEIITNGDLVNEKSLIEVYKSKATRLIISLYDGPEQITKFKNMIKKLKIPDDFVILRDRWYKGEEFSDYITNRAGTVKTGKQPKQEELKDKTCYYPSYHAQIDWNGDMYLCPHDWQRRNPVGNLMQKNFFEIWSGKMLTYYRKMLFSGERKKKPCADCNCNGKVHGSKHFDAFKKIS